MYADEYPQGDKKRFGQNHYHYGITTKHQKLETDGKSIGSRILEFLDQAQPKLLVMGAYEHSKFRQTIIGGVTRDVLKNAKLPIMISH